MSNGNGRPPGGMTDEERSYADYRRERADAQWRATLMEKYDLGTSPEGLVPRELLQSLGVHENPRAIAPPLKEPTAAGPSQGLGDITAPQTVVPALVKAAPAVAKGIVKGATDLPADALGAVQDVVNWATNSHGEWAEKIRLFEKSTDPVEQMSRGAAAFLLSFATIGGAIGKLGTGIKIAREFPALLKTARTLGGAFGASFITQQGGLSFKAAEFAKEHFPEALDQHLEASVALLPLPVREAMDWLATENPDDPAVEQRFKMALTNVVDAVLIGKLFQVGKFLAKAGPALTQGGAPGGAAGRAATGRLGQTERGGAVAMIPKGYTRLYRGQGLGGAKLPDWIRDGLEESGALGAQGRWFTDRRDIAEWYAKEAGQAGHIVVVDVPTSVAKSARASKNPIALRFSRDPEREFFLPMEEAKRAK